MKKEKVYDLRGADNVFIILILTTVLASFWDRLNIIFVKYNMFALFVPLLLLCLLLRIGIYYNDIKKRNLRK